MRTTPVLSDSIRAVGYDAATRTLRVVFRHGGVYDYADVDPGLYEQLLTPHPWRRVGELVKAHDYRRVAD